MDSNKNHQELQDRSDLLLRAQESWEAMFQFREDRQRCKRFTYGDQWSDKVHTPSGLISEEDHILQQGNMPLKNNLIRRLVRNVLGVFRNQWNVPLCVARDPDERPQALAMQRLLEYNLERNRMEEVYARTMEEFLISGMAVHKKWYGEKGGRADCWTDTVSPERFFVDPGAEDFRNLDISIIGEIHDLDLDSVCAALATDGEEYKRIHDYYQHFPNVTGGFCPMQSEGVDGLVYRVIEVWTREYSFFYRCHDPLSGECFEVAPDDFKVVVERENDSRRRRGETSLITFRWERRETWRYHFLTPTGAVIKEGNSPYSHGGHPYIFKAYPFIDGEIHSFVADIIDQQKFTNRLISMYDWILRASAKGVLLFPEGGLPQGISLSDVADEWSRFNGVILYNPSSGVPVPQQLHSTTANHGISDLLSIQMKLIEDISGVSGALQGKLDSSSMSGTLYDQQTRNSLTALADLLKCYNDFILEATAMDVANIRQYYSPYMIASILGIKDPLAPNERFFDSSFDFSIRQRGEEKKNSYICGKYNEYENNVRISSFGTRRNNDSHSGE